MVGLHLLFFFGSGQGPAPSRDVRRRPPGCVRQRGCEGDRTRLGFLCSPQPQVVSAPQADGTHQRWVGGEIAFSSAHISISQSYAEGVYGAGLIPYLTLPKYLEQPCLAVLQILLCMGGEARGGGDEIG